jgi:hypothetical protein
MALKCYTKPRKNGSKYTTCNKDIKDNKSHSRTGHKSGPKKGSAEAKKVMAKARAAQSKPAQGRYNLRKR